MSLSHMPPEPGKAQPMDRESEGQQAAVGILLVHGLNANRGDMEELALSLAAQGMVIENMLLPGHSPNVRDRLSIGWPEWADAVRREVHMLKKCCEQVFLIGHSLGGALCLHTAAHEEVAGVVSMCAPLHMYAWMRPAVRLAKRFTPFLPTLREDICDPEARRRYRRRVYRWTPVAPVESMLRYLPELRAELPLVKAPTLIMNATHDHVVPASDGREIYRLISSQDKLLITFHRSYHVIMKDYEREEVFVEIMTFLRRLAYRTAMQPDRTT